MDVKFDEATEVALDDGRGTAVACETADEAIEPTDGRIVLCEADRDTLDGMFLTKSEYSPRPSFSKSTNFKACTSPSSSGKLLACTSAAKVKPSGALMS